jgi:hypothetical protein
VAKGKISQVCEAPTGFPLWIIDAEPNGHEGDTRITLLGYL